MTQLQDWTIQPTGYPDFVDVAETLTEVIKRQEGQVLG